MAPSVSPAERARVAGFTLIEIMVALAVFSLAVLALIRLEGATVRGASILDDTLVANLVAHNVAVDAVTDGVAPGTGRESGVEVNAGRSWRWTREVRPTGNAQILRIDVAVQDRAGTVLGHTTMIRPPPAPPAVPSPGPSPTPTPGRRS
jgi:general secretion pathway protein I